MEPIKFKGQNSTYAKDQPEYLPLPVHKTACGIVTSCWRMTWIERIKMLLTGRIWWSILTFNNPLQPQLPSIDKPDWISDKEGEL